MAASKKTASKKAAPKKAVSKKGRRASVVKRKTPDVWARIFLWGRRFVTASLVLAVLFWAGAWFFLSNADTRSYDMAVEKVLAMSADAGFRVDNILVEGRENADRDVLLALINIQKGDPIFVFKPASAKELIERMAWVKTAQVERRLPGTIYIALTERKPLALWKKGGRLVLVGQEGQVLTDQNLKRFADLVMIGGEEAPENAGGFIRILEAEDDLRARVDSAQWIENRRWNLLLSDGKLIKLPERDVGLALRSLMVVQDEQGILDKNIKTIDLRDPARIVVRTELGQAMNIKTSAGESETL